MANDNMYREKRIPWIKTKGIQITIEENLGVKQKGARKTGGFIRSILDV